MLGPETLLIELSLANPNHIIDKSLVISTFLQLAIQNTYDLGEKGFVQCLFCGDARESLASSHI
jgi:hypothetical protein